MNEAEGAHGAGARATRSEWLLLGVLAAVQFVHVLDFVIIMPLGPQLMRTLEISPREFGLIVSAYTFAAAAAGLAAALWVDRYDRKRTLLTLLAGFALGTLACAFAPNYVLLLLARIVAGAFGGVLVAVVLAILGDQIPVARRGTAMGVVMSGFSTASVLGLPAGLYLAARLGWHAPFVLLAVLTVGVMVLAAAVLPPMRAHLRAEPRGASAVRDLVGVLRTPAHLRAFALSVVIITAGFTIVPFIGPYLVQNVGVREEELSLVYLVGGLLTLVSGPLAGRLSDRWGQVRVFTVAAALSVVPIVAMTTLPRVPLWTALAVTTALMVVASGRMVPAMALITGTVEPRHRGSFMSVNSSVQQLAAGVATFVAGLIIVEGPDGALRNYPLVGGIAVVAALASIPLARRLRPAAAAATAAPRVPEAGAAAAPVPVPSMLPYAPATPGRAAADS